MIYKDMKNNKEELVPTPKKISSFIKKKTHASDGMAKKRMTNRFKKYLFKKRFLA